MLLFKRTKIVSKAYGIFYCLIQMFNICSSLNKKEILLATTNYQYIYSPLYPLDFPAITHYTWSIYGSRRCIIQIEFANFSLATGPEEGQCPKQYLILIDGEEDPTHKNILHLPYVKFCGTTPPPSMQSSNNNITIALISNLGGQGKYPEHFALKYKYIPVKPLTPSYRMPQPKPMSTAQHLPAILPKPYRPKTPSEISPMPNMPPVTLKKQRPVVHHGRIRASPASMSNLFRDLATEKTVTTTTRRPKRRKIPQHIKALMYVFCPIFSILISLFIAIKYWKWKKQQLKRKEENQNTENIPEKA